MWHCGVCRGLGHSAKTCQRESPAAESEDRKARKLAQVRRENMEWLLGTPARDYADDNHKHKREKPPFYTHLFVWHDGAEKWMPAIRVVF